MLVHLVPRFLDSPDVLTPVDCLSFKLVGKGFTAHLLGGKDIVTRKPYPNRRYSVVCRKIGRRSVNGILLEFPVSVSSFFTISHWRVNNETFFHKVSYSITDSEYSAVSDDMMLWSGTCRWASRWPDYAEKWVPAIDSPMMSLVPYKGKERQGEISYAFSFERFCGRSEAFSLPTIQHERLLEPDFSSFKIPEVDSIFRVVE